MWVHCQNCLCSHSCARFFFFETDDFDHQIGWDNELSMCLYNLSKFWIVIKKCKFLLTMNVIKKIIKKTEKLRDQYPYFDEVDEYEIECRKNRTWYLQCDDWRYPVLQGLVKKRIDPKDIGIYKT